MSRWQQRLRFAARLPLWGLGVLTQAKSFKDNPILGSQRLNRAGLHVGRVATAQAMTKLRRLRLASRVPRQERDQFARDGFLVLPNFLPLADFEALRRAAREIPQAATALQLELRENVQGDTLSHRFLIDTELERAFSSIARLTKNKRFSNLLCYCSANRRAPLHYLQAIVNGVTKGPRDPQKTLHADTFHPSLKAWLFLDDVREANGPFTYVPGSHRLTLERMRWEYRRSVDRSQRRDGYSEKGSPRIDEAELTELGLGPPVSVLARANTLVVADTFGFHRRGDAAPGAARSEIWSYGRTNPFAPFAGLRASAIAKLEHRLAKEYWRFKDRDAASRGSRSSWHILEPEQFMSSGAASATPPPQSARRLGSNPQSVGANT